MVLSRILHLARRIITPLVSGVVVMIIGLSLIQVGLTSIGGGYAAMADHTFGAPKNLLLAGIVLALIIIPQPPAQPVPAHRLASDCHGCRLSGGVDSSICCQPTPPRPTAASSPSRRRLYYGLGIDWSLLLPLMLVFMITSSETIGDITATSDVSEQPVSGPLYMKRLKGGVLANGLNSLRFRGLQHLPELLLRPEQRRDPADRGRQPLRRLCSRPDADRPRPVPSGEAALSSISLSQCSAAPRW